MRVSNGRVWQAILCTAVLVTPLLAGVFNEDFSAMPVGGCYPDGSTFDVWKFVYNGYGCNAFVSANSNTMLVEQPKASTSPSETHAALVVGPAVIGDFKLDLLSATVRQLRSGSAPNPWEVGWVLWHYADDTHFYYFAPKPNGWELGKEDPGYPGAQRFLATASSPSFPIGTWYHIGIEQTGTTIRVSVNDQVIATVTDSERPYSSGNIALYSEDAEVYFDNISISTTDTPRPGKGKKKPAR
jgi:hypothetical protein